MITLRRVALSALIAPLALSVSACGDKAAEGDALEGEPIAAIAAPDGQQWADVTTLTPEGGAQIGNPDAPLKLVEYASHTCHVCADFAKQGSEPLRENYINTGKVSYELRNLVRDPVDLTIAALARCGDIGRFIPRADQAWIAFDEVMASAQANGQAIQQAAQLPPEQRFIAIANQSGMIDFFASRGLSEDQAKICLADNSAIEQIANNSQKQGDELQVNGTPSFFLNGNKVQETSWAGIEPILQRAGAR